MKWLQDMRYGIFSDIHSNLEAFESVLNSMDSERLDAYIFAGDIVGYGADFLACIDLVKETADKVICGNHDWASAGLLDLGYFNPATKEAVDWTAKCLNKDETDYLKSLKLTYEEKGFTVVHGSLEKPEKFGYILNLYAALKNFELLQRQILFVGHTHSPITFLKSGDNITYTRLGEIRINRDTQYIVNVGSVGQPRDGDPRACYAIYDDKEGAVYIKRVPYNIKKAQAKIVEAGLPAQLAERLGVGW